MQELTPNGNAAVENLAARYNVSADAVRTLLFAVSAGGGTMAQFYHPELGGGGQWMAGGMTMVGDMFNHGLQALVSGLCSELSNLLSSQQVFQPVPRGPSGGTGQGMFQGNSWWPAELGNPSSSGGQNDARYAYFPQAQRLAIDRGGQITIYDTLDHQIGGVQQQQGGPWGSLSFSSQRGTFGVESLPQVSPAPAGSFSNSGNSQPMAAEPAFEPNYGNAPPPQTQFNQGSGGHDAVLTAIERLSDLHKRGIVSDDEFRQKKAELLSRL